MFKKIIFILLIITLFYPVSNSHSGIPGAASPFYFLDNTDTSSSGNFSIFDLRNRESYIQLTNVEQSENITLHVKIFNVNDNCNENNFFDVYTPNDTHIYNMRDIITNDGNPSGVTLPNDAYGVVIVTVVIGNGPIMIDEIFPQIIGNFRIIDDSGYEYRTNSAGLLNGIFIVIIDPEFRSTATFNFNKEKGVILSDIIGIPVAFTGDDDDDLIGGEFFNFDISNPLDAFSAFDVDIINNNEVVFSCRDVIYACVDEDNPLLDELLQQVGDDDDDGAPSQNSSANVARFEYGINEAIPNSKGGELLCPGNNIPEGIVKLRTEASGNNTFLFAGYIGLNNGNGRGSMDSLWSLDVSDRIFNNSMGTGEVKNFSTQIKSQ